MDRKVLQTGAGAQDLVTQVIGVKSLSTPSRRFAESITFDLAVHDPALLNDLFNVGFS